ncbi:MAG: hypothetical protein WBM32_09125, partial [Crocosphaera sp.]
NWETEMGTNGLQTEIDGVCPNGLQTDELNLSTNGLQTETAKMTTNGTQILPTSERQVRPLTKLDPHQQREAWQKAVASANGKVPSSRIVKSIVDQIRQRTPVPNPWRKGEVARDYG